MPGVVESVIGKFIINALIGSLVSTAVNKIFGKKAMRGGPNAAQSAIIQDADSPRRLIYGRTQMGGNLVYEVQSDDASVVWFVIYIGEGEVEAIEPVFWIGDERSDDPKYAGALEMRAYLGTQNQGADAELVANSRGEWTFEHRMRGMAYVVVKQVVANKDAFPQWVKLNLRFVVRGRKVYDPRTGVVAWSRNRELIELDYRRHPLGYNLPDSALDFAHTAAMAQIADEVISTTDQTEVVDGQPGRVRRYTFDGMVETTTSRKVALDSMRRNAWASGDKDGGKCRTTPEHWRAPTGPVLTEDFLRDYVQLSAGTSPRQRVNVVRGTHRSPHQDWQTTDYPEVRMPQSVIELEGEIVESVDFPNCTSAATAQRLAKQYMLRARSNVPLFLPCIQAAYIWQRGDVLRVNLPRLQLEGEYEVVSTKYLLGRQFGVDLTLRPMRIEDFAWNSAVDEVPVVPVKKPSFKTGPVAALTGVEAYNEILRTTAQGAVYGLRLQWNQSQNRNIFGYDVEWRESSAEDWLPEVVPTAKFDGHFSSAVRPTNAWRKELSTGATYDLRVRAAQPDGRKGPWSTISGVLCNGDTTPPAAPTNISLTVTGPADARIAWTTPEASDFSCAELFVANTNSPGSSTLLTKVYGLQSTAYSYESSVSFFPAHYWLRSVDKSNNKSALTYVGVVNEPAP